jgi:putative transposase
LVFIFENLKIQNMTKRAKPKKDVNGKYIKNGAAAKSGLNKAILEKGWYKVKMYTLYKANREGKYCFSIGAHYTSQECATCGHTHPDNRKTQSDFLCIGCGYSEDADRNASDIIKKRAIQLILYSGTELSKGLLGKSLDTGRGANVRLQNHKSGIAAVATKR